MIKKVAAFIHLWLGLISGLVITIVALTGCIYVFEEELFNAFHKDLVEVKPAEKKLPLHILNVNAGRALLPGEEINRVEIKSGDKAYIFSANKPMKNLIPFIKKTNW